MRVRLVAALAIMLLVLTSYPERRGANGLDIVREYFKGADSRVGARRLPTALRVGRHAAIQARRGYRNEHVVARAKPAVRASTDPKRELELSAYQGLAAWVDIFDRGPWANPYAAVWRMKHRGAQTLFLQTSTYGIKKSVFRRQQIAKFIRAAHARNIEVVAWYVPSFGRLKRDRYRIGEALRFKTPRGDGFDSFAMDIEATVVDKVTTRNRRLLRLSNWLRDRVGDSYPLGAITPDPCCSLYWPNFPYRRVRTDFDVFVPMGYWTFRASGYNPTKNYTSRNIAIIRRETGDPEVPIHMIGGIADSAGNQDLKGFVAALRQNEVLGASLYDFPITSKTAWKTLEPVRRHGRSEAEKDTAET